MLPNSLDEQFWNFFRDSYARITANHVVTHTNFYWVEKIISRFCYVNLKRILFRWLVRHRLTLYAQSYPLYFLISLSTSPLHDEHRNIETLSPIKTSDSQKRNQHSSENWKVESPKCDTVSPDCAKPKTCFIRKMHGTWYKTCLLYGNFSDASLLCFKRGNSLKDMLVRAKLSRSQRRQIRYTKVSTVEELWSPVNPC